MACKRLKKVKPKMNVAGLIRDKKKTDNALSCADCGLVKIPPTTRMIVAQPTFI